MYSFSQKKKVSHSHDPSLDQLAPLVLVGEARPDERSEDVVLDPNNRPVVEAPESEGATALSEAAVASERREPSRGRSVSCHRAKYAFWWMPASGEQKDDCGDWLKSIGCPCGEEGHDRWNILKHCDDPRCPICWEHWAGREAFRASERFLQVEPLYGRMQRRLGSPKHVTFSPPSGEAVAQMATKEGYRKLRKSLVKWVRWAGMVGGAIVFHPFRERDGSWYPSPHWHVVGYGYLVQSDVFYDHTGWVYKNLGIRDSVPGTIKYTLTHCGVAYDANDQRMFHALTWFGVMAYNQMVIDHREKEYVTVPCSVCGEDLHEFTEDFAMDRGVFLLKVERTTWRLRRRLVQSKLPPPRKL